MHDVVKQNNNRNEWWTATTLVWTGIAIALGLALLIYRDGIAYMVH